LATFSCDCFFSSLEKLLFPTWESKVCISWTI
jgi:hypothetical protein